MELINRQDAIKTLRDTFLGDTYEIDVVACGMIESLPTVDAIPVTWLYDLADKKEEEKDIKLSAMIKGVVALWHREKQNESY